jgi:uncharacterized membrane protein
MENIDKKTKILAALSYIPFPPLFVIPLFISKKDTFVEFHGKQGFVVFLAWFGLWLLGLVPLVAVLSYFGFLALIVSAVIAIAKTWRAERWNIPLLGKYAEKIKL